MAMHVFGHRIIIQMSLQLGINSPHLVHRTWLTNNCSLSNVSKTVRSSSVTCDAATADGSGSVSDFAQTGCWYSPPHN